MTKAMEKLKDECDDNLQIVIEQCRSNNEFIRRKMIDVFGKLETVLNQVAIPYSLRADQERLGGEFETVLRALRDSQTGLSKKCGELKQKVDYYSQDTNVNSEDDYSQQKEEISDDQLRDIFRIL